ncbi:alpha-glucuronidase family glycosyl hydrolase [Arcticibacter eurypsychrophilus]|uniref:alpha-glucuronidase family glycosyl hydrolase n=1 Tax=Arcticibacter eurypsychrophilus TaxID=1434752 RepID=UPI00084DE406|nr:alpha-glucuronidase family glycosyl hydrolase [Arcticibacter eurypsychrophilus]
MKKRLLILTLLFWNATSLLAESGYRLWMRYDLVINEEQRGEYINLLKNIAMKTPSASLRAASQELEQGLSGLLGRKIPVVVSGITAGSIVAGTPLSSTIIKGLKLNIRLETLGEEGYLLSSIVYQSKKVTVIAANSDIGVMYGVFHLLRLIQTNQSVSDLNITDQPRLKYRVLNHWDNLDRTVERGYAGFSLWNWHTLPGYVQQRYVDYARANASIGINGTVLTNVNANSLILTDEYLPKVAAIANVLRPYGIKVYLTARFSSPIELGKLKTADPLNEEVKKWWKDKTDEIYTYIPDFGGFLVKANSEGQPGPQSYGRSHADGANVLADALAPHKGIVMWRAFVYSNDKPEDRFKQAFNEFKPLDGQFRANVMVQVKNGPIDFQPREPFSPLFGAMPKTPLMMEFQITQEYLGQGTHLVYQAPLYKEVLDADTYTKGKGSTVAKVIDGSLDNHSISGMAGVANIGDDLNWTGHLFGQSNWYAFGRLAWNHELSSIAIADEWTRMTFTNDTRFVQTVKGIMMNSRENLVNYMTPLGLHHIMGWDHHYGPGPWIKDKPRADWTAFYYHKADRTAIGFDRTASGSNALSQYAPEVSSFYGDLKTCPPEYLLWFHRLPWTYQLKDGKSLWESLCQRYQFGAASMEGVQKDWNSIAGIIDQERFEQVKMLLAIQKEEVWWWHDACLAYFQSRSELPFPARITAPKKSLEFYENQVFHFVPGI